VLWLLTKVVEIEPRRFKKMSTLCHVSCFVELWSLVTDGKPIDRSSPLFDEISSAIFYYFRKPLFERSAIGALERKILPDNYAPWVLRDKLSAEAERREIFVHEHGLLDTINKHVNIHNYINLRAAERVSDLEIKSNQDVSAKFWRTEVSKERLPPELRLNPTLRRMMAYLKKSVRDVQRDLARKNYLKLEFSMSDITALATLTGTVLGLSITSRAPRPSSSGSSGTNLTSKRRSKPRLRNSRFRRTCGAG
jgi:hypothetical protein